MCLVYIETTQCCHKKTSSGQNAFAPNTITQAVQSHHLPN